MSETTLYFGCAAAALFACVHILSTRFSNLLSRDELIAGSLGGGIAVGFVFLELIPELDHGHDVVGETIEIVTLIGFLIIFGLFRAVPLHGAGQKRLFIVRLAAACISSWLLIFSFPFSTGMYDAVTCLLLVVHVAFLDHRLRDVDPHAFDRYGRWVLVVFTVLGWLSMVFFGHLGELPRDLLTGVLAGFMMYQVFSKEVPLIKSSGYMWFVGGVMTFLGLHLLQKFSDVL